MLTTEDRRPLLHRIIASDNFQQVAPLIVIFLIPLLVLVLHPYIGALYNSALMVFESIFPWNWSNSHASSPSSSDRRKSRKKLVRTRAEQPAMNGDAVAGSSKDAYVDDAYYPGIVNISGTYCFMDSTLQALASLSYLQPQIDRIHRRAEDLDVPTPVIDALRDILHTLNTPITSPRAIRPIEMIDALARHSQGKQNALFSSREHQDAQELFQLISECIKSETAAVDKEGLRDRGLGGLTEEATKSRQIGKSVFDGLTANRRSCMQCGYTEAVMHFAFDNWQLSVPRAAACMLEECLTDYTRLEVLDDCICRKCSMQATYYRLSEEADRLAKAVNADKDPSASKRKRAREAKKYASRVKAALDEGRIEEDIRGVTLERVFSKASTKQAMVARPPPVLALHLNRSVHYGHYASKNNCRVIFPEVLDLTPFTTSGQLSTIPSKPISTPPPNLPLHLARSTTPTPATYTSPRTLYRLSAVVCHYGSHSFGHYICYRRKPRPKSLGEDRRWAPPKLACPLRCECEKCQMFGPIRDDELPGKDASSPGRGWLRISDDSVRECGWETVIQESSGAFMLYYERVVLPGIYLSPTPRGSEETLKPKSNGNGSCTSLASLTDGEVAVKSDSNAAAGSSSTSSSHHSRELNGVPNGDYPLTVVRPQPRKLIKTRVVRNVSMRPKRSSSLPPPELRAPRVEVTADENMAKSMVDLKKGTTEKKMNGSASHAHPPEPQVNGTSTHSSSVNGVSSLSSTSSTSVNGTQNGTTTSSRSSSPKKSVVEVV